MDPTERANFWIIRGNNVLASTASREGAVHLAAQLPGEVMVVDGDVIRRLRSDGRFLNHA